MLLHNSQSRRRKTCLFQCFPVFCVVHLLLIGSHTQPTLSRCFLCWRFLLIRFLFFLIYSPSLLPCVSLTLDSSSSASPPGSSLQPAVSGGWRHQMSSLLREKKKKKKNSILFKPTPGTGAKGRYSLSNGICSSRLCHEVLEQLK